MTAELTKARLRRGFASLEALRAHGNDQSNAGHHQNGADSTAVVHPRWIRINALRTFLDEQLKTTFADYDRVSHLRDVASGDGKAKLLYVDQNVPNLIAIPPSIDIVNDPAYKEGRLILQEKASCFPGLLLDSSTITGDIIDACAAPGNKTTHLAAVVASHSSKNASLQDRRRIFACERDALRSQTLAKMVKLAGAEDMIEVKAKQDFMKLDPMSKEFANVTCLLLDPSCSGSGIIGRDDVGLKIHIPSATNRSEQASKGKKRKRHNQPENSIPDQEIQSSVADEETPTQFDANDPKLEARLSNLSAFQLRLLQHAMAFTAAHRITYSTCSVYDRENEHVVVKALLSDVASGRGWRILRRQDQVEGLKKWNKRGRLNAVVEILTESNGEHGGLDADDVADACIRCEKNSEDGTMGFFVAGFIRNAEIRSNNLKAKRGEVYAAHSNAANENRPASHLENEEEEWNGFSDSEP